MRVSKLLLFEAHLAVHEVQPEWTIVAGGEVLRRSAGPSTAVGARGNQRELLLGMVFVARARLMVAPAALQAADVRDVAHLPQLGVGRVRWTKEADVPTCTSCLSRFLMIVSYSFLNVAR